MIVFDFISVTIVFINAYLDTEKIIGRIIKKIIELVMRRAKL